VFETWCTRWCTGGEVKGKLANGVGSQYSHTTLERGVSSITNADAHISAASSQLNWHPHQFKWTRPFWRKTESGFCACTITFQMHYNNCVTIYSISKIKLTKWGLEKWGRTQQIMWLTLLVKNLDQGDVGLSPPLMYSAKDQNMMKRETCAWLQFIVIQHHRVMPVNSDSCNLNSNV